MELNRSGRVFGLDPKTGSVEAAGIRTRLRFRRQRAWRWRAGQRKLAPSSGARRGWTGRRKIVLGHLPVYPSRLSKAAGGGYWLTAFTRAHPADRVRAARAGLPAPHDGRDRPGLLGRPRGCARASPSRNRCRARTSRRWASSSHGRRRVPTAWSSGSAKTASRSIRCTASVDGVNHGVVAALELGGDLVLIAKGPGRVLKLPLAGLAEEYRLSRATSCCPCARPTKHLCRRARHRWCRLRSPPRRNPRAWWARTAPANQP